MLTCRARPTITYFVFTDLRISLGCRICAKTRLRSTSGNVKANSCRAANGSACAFWKRGGLARHCGPTPPQAASFVVPRQLMDYCAAVILAKGMQTPLETAVRYDYPHGSIRSFLNKIIGRMAHNELSMQNDLNLQEAFKRQDHYNFRYPGLEAGKLGCRVTFRPCRQPGIFTSQDHV